MDADATGGRGRRERMWLPVSLDGPVCRALPPESVALSRWCAMTLEPRTFDEAKAILAALGMPKLRQKLNPVCTFLAFANVGPRTPWSSAKSPRLRPHDVIVFRRETYGEPYARDPREAVRRTAIQPFVDGGILECNPDARDLPTHSLRTHYALTPGALRVVRAFGTPRFEAAAATFRAAQGDGLAERTAKSRRATTARTFAEGFSTTASRGAHDRLCAAIVEQFVPRFAAGSRVLYRRSPERKTRRSDGARLARVGIPVAKHDALPDLVLHDETRGWLFFIGTASIGRPASIRRHEELAVTLGSCKLARVHVLAFPSFRAFVRFADGLAWATEVWIADTPEHLLYFNGDRFLGPR